VVRTKELIRVFVPIDVDRRKLEAYWVYSPILERLVCVIAGANLVRTAASGDVTCGHNGCSDREGITGLPRECVVGRPTLNEDTRYALQRLAERKMTYIEYQYLCKSFRATDGLVVLTAHDPKERPFRCARQTS